MTAPVDPDREPFAEHKFPAVVPQEVNTELLAEAARSDPAGVAAYFRHLSARALGEQFAAQAETADADVARRT